MQMKRARKIFKLLKTTPVKGGSGLSDVSENHDYYLAFPNATGPAPPEFNAPVPSPQSRISKKSAQRVRKARGSGASGC